MRVAYSARDHVLLGLYRDRPELRGSPEFLRAVLARQGGDPEQLDLEGDYRARRAGAGGSGFLWRRWTGLGQLLVFPGFVNLLTFFVAIDLDPGRARRRVPGDRPRRPAASVLVALLGVVHLVHQLRAGAQGFEVLRRLP